jgi:hypothetical protein
MRRRERAALGAAWARVCRRKVVPAYSAWGARATQAMAWRRKVAQACSGRARGSACVRDAAHVGAWLGRREALHGLWRGGARVARALAWRRKGSVGLQR